MLSPVSFPQRIARSRAIIVATDPSIFSVDFSLSGLMMTAESRLMKMSYKSGATDIGEMWLVPKNNDTLSPADTARYIYEAIQNNQAVSVPFGWLGTVGNYINVLHECSGINAGEYYLAWKAITDNTSPMICAVKVVDVTI